MTPFRQPQKVVFRGALHKNRLRVMKKNSVGAKHVSPTEPAPKTEIQCGNVKQYVFASDMCELLDDTAGETCFAPTIGAALNAAMECFFHLALLQQYNTGGVFRSAGIEIMDDYDNDLEKLLDYMELTRELEREKLFIFVNLRSYYNDDGVAAFLSSAISHEYQMLLIDSVSRAHIPMESRITIDIDLCEF